ncbi:hypothetical protein PILCRDRAFT_4830 [Piloderma croceum F 1598]|uniref:Uncharacterized protein n=1 Tax=Piloderma croceum (strain F 1598) TaxID=765440 RepID=A0A0C3G385_PILCF|nr:hypothetical protein PILCRDRAFT_4830 [Piloderma croceum F 1598]
MRLVIHASQGHQVERELAFSKTKPRLIQNAAPAKPVPTAPNAPRKYNSPVISTSSAASQTVTSSSTLLPSISKDHTISSLMAVKTAASTVVPAHNPISNGMSISAQNSDFNVGDIVLGRV